MAKKNIKKGQILQKTFYSLCPTPLLNFLSTKSHVYCSENSLFFVVVNSVLHVATLRGWPTLLITYVTVLVAPLIHF